MRLAIGAAAIWVLLVVAPTEPSSARAAPATVVSLGLWQSALTGGGTAVPASTKVTVTTGESKLTWNAGAVHGKVKPASPALVSFTATLPFDVTGDGQVQVHIAEDIDVFVTNATLTTSVDLYQGTTKLQGIVPVKLVRKKPGNDLIVTQNWGYFLSAGSYEFRAAFKIKRKKSGSWDHHSANSRDFVATVTLP